jgi:rod shape-determining protein MreC
MLKSQRWLLFIGGIVILGILGFAGLLKPLQRFLQAMTLPLMQGASQTRNYLADAWRGNVSSEDAIRVQQLEERLRALAVDYVRLQSLEEENRLLRSQAEFLSSSGYDSVGARVISRELRHQQALFLIDRGLDDGVEIGQAVVTGGGVYIGKISSIKDRVATVELLTDPRARVTAANGDRLIGVVEGKGNGAAMLTYIPPSESLRRDQVITTAGTEEKVPAHLPLGVINLVQGKPTDPFLTASLEPLASFERVTLVSILRPTALRPDGL